MSTKRKKILNALLVIFFLVSLLITLYVKFFQTTSKQWIMPGELNEISGICFTDDNFLACIQDEKGVIFIYDLENSSIHKKIRFAGKGDYEGIAIAGDTAYVLTGDGILYEVKNFSNFPVVTSYFINLSKTEESEAICYDKVNNRLLIALKDRKKNKINPDLFSFDLTNKQFQINPVLRVNFNEDLFKKFKLDDLKSYWEPADLAIDTTHNKILVVDAINHNLIELSNSGELQKVNPLDPKLFPHPEGVAIRNDGSVFICNDGNKDGTGSIILFEN